jgi:hypothetical protein
MALVTLNPMIERIQRKLGNVVFRRTAYGKTAATKIPDMSDVKWSKAQKEHRQRFKQAIVYARAAMADPKVRAKYEKTAAKQGKRTFDLVVSDFFHGKNLLEKS